MTGLLELDSGKTSVTAALVREARAQGVDAIAVKPLGAHSAWYQHDTLERSIEMKMLIGEDAYRLWIASDKAEPIELLSPLDMMIAPPELQDIRRLDSYLFILNNTFKQVVMVRTTKLKGHDITVNHYLVEDIVELAPLTLRQEVIKLARMVRAKRLISNKVFDLVMRSIEASDQVLEYLAARHELVIIESFNNATHPSPSSLLAEKVVLVAPGRAYIFDGREYARVVEDIAKTKGLTITTCDVIRYVKPLGSVELHPRSEEELDKPREDTRKLLGMLLEG
ncbi:MAG: hypothetical protein DRM97_02350 [Thermoprotei archaeon]|nr:MAG: hypothetical protein DRM97_02350 [Thermoprotei archaeon]